MRFNDLSASGVQQLSGLNPAVKAVLAQKIGNEIGHAVNQERQIQN
ncbi:hypothetical protein QAO71_16970 (plasmid) [Halopseudomonas sp. SMJS2]|nr:hypothetical protein [Halopseudomonas sp. SMJS2]WGK63463.1 hypothetical protein QAO71_16970 [Halopseudomonas sp. SMJS2]